VDMFIENRKYRRWHTHYVFYVTVQCDMFMLFNTVWFMAKVVAWLTSQW